MRFALAIALLAAVLSTSASAGTRAGADGVLYEVTFSGKGAVEAIGSSPAGAWIKNNHSELTANWTFTAEPVRMALANVKGSITAKIVTTATAPLSGGGTVSANEQFTWYDHKAPQTPLLGTSTCNAKVVDSVSAVYTAEATNGGIDFTVDLAGAFRTDGGVQVPCQSEGERGQGQPVDGDYSIFDFAWDPQQPPQTTTAPYNQQMQLFDQLQRFQVGMPSIDLVLTDRSQVNNAENCLNLDLTACNVNFHLTKLELNLKKICSGPLGADGQVSCGGQGGGSQPKKPPVTSGGHTPPKLTKFKVTPASFPLSDTNVTLSYHDDQPGSTTMLKLVGTLYGHEVPLEVFTHVDTTANVSMRLPRIQAVPALLRPGTFHLEATPTNPKSGRGATATATFVITH